MAVAKPWLRKRYFSDSYASIAIDSDVVDLGGSTESQSQSSSSDGSTIGQSQPMLFGKIIEARGLSNYDNWDGEGALAIVQETVDMSLSLLYALPTDLPVPQITPETTGEIAFEWYRDKRHLAVLTVDGEFIRWAALIGTDSPITGSEPYTKTVPIAAVEAIQSALR